MKPRSPAVFVSAALLGCFVARSGLTDFAEGLAAYDGGDFIEAVRQWRSAANAGDIDATVALADLYAAGLGVAANPAEAARLYRSAAERGNPIAQLNLGDFYSRGYGVGLDLVEATKWLTRAHANGHVWAGERLAEIRLLMTETEVKRAQRILGAEGSQ